MLLADLDPNEVAIAPRAPAATLKTHIYGAVIGLVLGIVYIWARETGRLVIGPRLIPLLAIAYLMSVLVHEAAHATVALVLRVPIAGFAIWPVAFRRERPSWRIEWLPRDGPKGFITVTGYAKDTARARLFAIVAAGPLASMIFSAGGWLGLRSHVVKPGWIREELYVIALCSAVFAVASFGPSRVGSLLTDGARLALILRAGAPWDRLIAQQAIVEAAARGTRPGDWDPERLKIAAGSDDGSADSRAGRTLVYNSLADRGCLDEAEQQLVWLLDQPWPKPALADWRFEAAWFAAVYRQDATTARRWSEAGKKIAGAQSTCSLAAAEAALAFVEKRWDDLPGLIAHALEDCDRLTDTGTALAIREALLRMKEAGGCKSPQP